MLSTIENTEFWKCQSRCHEVFIVWNTFCLLRWIFWWLCRSLVTLNKCQWEVAGMCQKPKCNQNSKCHLLHPKTASDMHYLFSSTWQLFGHALEMHIKCFWRCFLVGLSNKSPLLADKIRAGKMKCFCWDQIAFGKRKIRFPDLLTGLKMTLLFFIICNEIHNIQRPSNLWWLQLSKGYFCLMR